MSKSYWRSAKAKIFIIVALLLAVLIGAPIFAATLQPNLIVGFPPVLLFFCLGMPLALLILTMVKSSMQQGHDRTYEVDTEDKLRRRAVPKRLKSFPVKAEEVAEAHWPKGERPQDKDAGETTT
ncbi:MAG: hypothetical protein ABJO09_06025 [Hyphomicrobiales bacterium]